LRAIASVNSSMARNTGRHNHRVELDYGVSRTEGESQPDRISRRLISFTCQRGASRRAARRPNDKTRRRRDAERYYATRAETRTDFRGFSPPPPRSSSPSSARGLSAPIALLLYFVPCIRSRAAGEVRVLRPRPPLCHPLSPTQRRRQVVPVESMDRDPLDAVRVRG